MSKYLQCKECTKIFSYPESQQQDYRKRGWPAPVRCTRCQQISKERRSNPYWGWESTMGSSASMKKRHRRVNYPAHVVGGFR